MDPDQQLKLTLPLDSTKSHFVIFPELVSRSLSLSYCAHRESRDSHFVSNPTHHDVTFPP